MQRAEKDYKRPSRRLNLTACSLWYTILKPVGVLESSIMGSFTRTLALSGAHVGTCQRNALRRSDQSTCAELTEARTS